MPKYVIHYFNLKAIGEGIRMMLAYSGEEFEDKRISNEQDPQWAIMKPKTPHGTLPVLEVDGKKYSQTSAISRYLGHKFGIAGSTLEEDLEIDQTLDFVRDIYADAAIVHYEPDKALKAKKYAEYSTKVYPVLLGKLDEIIKKNNGHLAIGKLTWADFFFAGVFDYLKMMLQMPDLEIKYPSYKKLIDNVMTLPQIQTYLKNAPNNPV